ncbi:MAG TPA: response regulator transcription factor [Fibrobacteria bacterium]|nr:response regulator transcription factor [Fibrobacteria bacterium]
MKIKALLIDDDRKLAGLLTEYLRRFEIILSYGANGDDGLRMLRIDPPDCVLLDVMLPGKDGFEVCREIRKPSDVPVIMLTARGEVADRIVGLEIGADDYLPKPFEPRELAARIQAVLRRKQAPVRGEILRCGDLEVDMGKRTAVRNGEDLRLTALEFDALAVFARFPGVVLHRERLVDLLKGGEWDPVNRSLDVLVSRLRQKLGDDPQTPRYLKTVRGTGYLFLGGLDDEAGE